MTRTAHFIFSLLFVVQLIMLGACAGAKKDTGYYKTSQLISKDSVDKLKARVRAISNDIFKAFQYTGTGKTPLKSIPAILGNR